MTTARGKILSPGELLARVQGLREAGKKIVFTNGVFDLLHVGHIRYLEAAKALGDVLVVAVNGDESARRLGKGPGRPVNAAAARAEVVAALAAVDFVTIFEEDTPRAVIEKLLPDVLVKGGDWQEEEIVGADVVRARGGVVKSLPYEEGFSTSATISKIKNV